MIENVDHFHPSPEEIVNSFMELGKKLIVTTGPDDVISIRAGDLVVLMAESVMLRERVAKLAADSHRRDQK
jgi:hypothetical protein